VDDVATLAGEELDVAGARMHRVDRDERRSRGAEAV